MPPGWAGNEEGGHNEEKLRFRGNGSCEGHKAERIMIDDVLDSHVSMQVPDIS